MRPLVWIMINQKAGNGFNGFLLLLLFLFIIFYTVRDDDRGIYSIENESAEYPEGMEMSAFHKVTLGIPVNINRESVEGLTAIPGIGKSLALTIEAERKKRKGFKDINELKTIPGIGDKLFLKISPYIRL